MPALVRLALPPPVRAWSVLLILLAAVIGGCGKKGPPLAPLVSLPVAPTEVSARRLDDTVVIRFTVPAANASGVRPADIARVDVYAWTGESLPADEVFEHAAVVASVPVRRPPPPTEEGAPPPVVTVPREAGLDQGAAAEVREVLRDDALVPLEVPRRRPRETTRDTPLALTPPDLGPAMQELPPRRYVVVGVNRRGRRGRPAEAVTVPLWASPRPPGLPTATVTEQAVTLTWTAPEGVRVSIQPPTLAKPPAAAAPGARPGPAGTPSPTSKPVGRPPQEDEPLADAPTADGDDRAPDEDLTPEGLERPAEAVRPGAEPDPTSPDGTVRSEETEPAKTAGEKRLASRLLFPWPDGSTGYRVYEVLPKAAEPPEVPPPPAAQPYPRVLTPTPLTTTRYADTRVEFGVERCYVVRTVESVGGLNAESAPSEPVCIEPSDVFPPGAPRSLGAVASEGAISLIWDRNPEPDLGGYIVLRGVAPGDPVEPITPQPIKETTYRDTAVTPGTRYVYVVVAVDNATPPNASPPSNRVEETAR